MLCVHVIASFSVTAAAGAIDGTFVLTWGSVALVLVGLAVVLARGGRASAKQTEEPLSEAVPGGTFEITVEIDEPVQNHEVPGLQPRSMAGELVFSNSGPTRSGSADSRGRP